MKLWFDNPLFWEKLNEREIRFPCVVHLNDTLNTWAYVMFRSENPRLFWYKINLGTFRDVYKYVACDIARSRLDTD